MSDRPLGIDDLPTYDYWYWCRRHEQAEHVSTPAVSHESKFCVGCLSGDHEKPQPCIRIGPFMSESEAQRLDDYQQYVGYPGKPLGMDIER